MSDESKPIIRAIETCFKGFRFRSRMEARWAVALDALGIEWLYESEGYALSTGDYYLPDFFLPHIGWHAEVKPAPPTDEEHRKGRALVKESRRPLLWLVGPPDFRTYIAYCWDSGNFTDCDYSLDIYAHGAAYQDEHRLFSCPDLISEDTCSSQYRQAVYASRAARFDGTDYPQIGHEPFNVSDGELLRMLRSWR